MKTFKSTEQQIETETFALRGSINFFDGRLSCRHEGGRVRIRVPRRQECLTRRAMIAALREAELAEWQATGGDFLAGMHQPV